MNTNPFEQAIKTKDDALQQIIGLGFDYDGLGSPEDLKKLIDELVQIAKIGFSREA